MVDASGGAAVETTFFVVGAGPAGASLAAILASYGLGGLLVSSAPGTATEPRAHITNAATLECLRDVGLEEACCRLATPASYMQHTRWCYSMAGEEIARTYAWGNQPDGTYQTASPCRHNDLPQTLLEPVLANHATSHGWTCKYNSTFVSFEKRRDRIVSSIRDNRTNEMWRVTSKYLFGCDGARSQVLRQAGIPLIKQPSQGRALNIHVQADLRHLMAARVGNLHWIFQPGQEHPSWGWCCVARMVKAWDEWMLIYYPHPALQCATSYERPTTDECRDHVRRTIGDGTPFCVIDIAVWNIHEVVAKQYSDGNIFCFGDSTHRHPPAYGLGSNTCIQDAYNLAWKLAYVERGQAHTSLLDSFSLERQPIGAGVIRHANNGIRDNFPIWDALGMLSTEIGERSRQHAELWAATDDGRKRRQKLQQAIKFAEREYRGLGVEMNQSYVSNAINLADEKGSRLPLQEPVLHYQASTYPGSRLPHAWLNTRLPQEKPISTVDLAGHGNFCLFTGIGGDAWKAACIEVSRCLQVAVKSFSIGWGQDWEDVYGDWANLREIDDDGCVLCRPDRAVCWRSQTMPDDCSEALQRSMLHVLGFVGDPNPTHRSVG